MKIFKIIPILLLGVTLFACDKQKNDSNSTGTIKTVSIDSFYLDEDEISSNEWKEYDIDNSINDLIGTYQYIEDSGNVLIRNWGKRYWELEIKNEGSKLSYFETGRGINSFNLSVNHEIKEHKIYIKHDSVISTAFLPPTEISELNKGDQLMILEKKEFGFLTKSDFLKININDSILTTEFKFVKIETKQAITKPKLH